MPRRRKQKAPKKGPKIPGEFLENYRLIKEIGRGAYSTVFEVAHLETDISYAAKIIDLSRLMGTEIARVQGEIEVLKFLGHAHENIVTLHEVFGTTANPDTEKVVIVLEFISGGELFDHVLAEQDMSEQEASLIMGCCLRALRTIHRIGVVHRDIKPENVLCGCSKIEEIVGPVCYMCVKIADFGTAVILTEKNEKVYDMCGTPEYAAPEIIKADAYDAKVDIWSLGVILYVLLCGKPPFWRDGEKTQPMFEYIMAGKYSMNDKAWETVTDAGKDLLKRMLEVDPTKRISAADACRHPWIAGATELPIDKSLTKADNFAKFHPQYKEWKRTQTTVGKEFLGRTNSVFGLRFSLPSMRRLSDGDLVYHDVRQKIEARRHAFKSVDDDDLTKSSSQNEDEDVSTMIFPEFERTHSLSVHNLGETSAAPDEDLDGRFDDGYTMYVTSPMMPRRATSESHLTPTQSRTASPKVEMLEGCLEPLDLQAHRSPDKSPEAPIRRSTHGDIIVHRPLYQQPSPPEPSISPHQLPIEPTLFEPVATASDSLADPLAIVHRKNPPEDRRASDLVDGKAEEEIVQVG